MKHTSPICFDVNPLGAFFGDDLNDQRAVAQFFRQGLNGLLAKHGAGLVCVHHTAKPSKERSGWRDGDLAYFGSGSADVANWAREVLTLRQTAPGLYELTATKRWRKLGWRDGDGKPTATRLIAHARDGSMVWQDATGDVLAELGGMPYSAAALCALVPAAGIDKAELVRETVETFTVSVRTAQTYIADSCRQRRHTVGAETIKCALFTTRSRPRREVYPDQPRQSPGCLVGTDRRRGAVVQTVMKRLCKLTACHTRTVWTGGEEVVQPLFRGLHYLTRRRPGLPHKPAMHDRVADSA